MADPTLLLQDLLSPPSASIPAAQLARQAAFHLASSPSLDLVALVARYTACSPALWRDTEDGSEAERERLELVYGLVRQAVGVRMEELSRPPEGSSGAGSSTSKTGGGGWTAGRALHAYLAALSSGLFADPPSSASSSSDFAVRPLVRLAMASGVLSALQEWKRRKEKLWVGGVKALGKVEGEVGRAWREWVQAGGPGRDQHRFAAWVAAHTIPFVEADVLVKEFPVPALLDYLTLSFSAAFSAGEAFSSPPLSADLSQTSQGLSWAAPSPSHSHLTALTASPLFVSLGPLSRSIGRTVEAAALVARTRSPEESTALNAIQHLSSTLSLVAHRLSGGWASTPWSDILLDSSLSPSTRSETAPWTLLKTLLFAQTLVYSSLLQVVSTTQNEGDEPTPVQRRLATEAVGALGKTYFVALKFGQAGFPAWRAVLAGLVEVVASGGEATEGEESAAEALMRSLEPAKGTGAGERHDRAVERAEATFWMNTVEQVMGELRDEYVERRVLRGIRPYLDDATYRDSFEAAHSIMLALFSSIKPCSTEIAPWYTELLLRTYPALLSPTQFRLAYSTLVGAVSASDDALAWWAVQELLEKIEALPVASFHAAAELSPSSRPALRDLTDDAPAAAPEPAVPELGAAPPISPLDTRALTLPRGGHLLALTALLPSVSLLLLPRLLSALEPLVRLEPVRHDGRAAVVEFAFQMLGEGMDAVKRVEGTEWWMRHGEGLVSGGLVEEEREAEEKMEEEKEEEVVESS
ncbi:hypothetical protein JCM8097_002576 [Rhodosporidiobolus ruineniae]